MAKMGRPRKGEERGDTVPVRLAPDLHEMLSDLEMVLDKTLGQLVDEAARIEIKSLHEKYKPQIEKAKAAQAAADEAIRQAKEEAAQLNQPHPKGHQPARRPKPGS